MESGHVSPILTRSEATETGPTADRQLRVSDLKWRTFRSERVFSFRDPIRSCRESKLKHPECDSKPSMTAAEIGRMLAYRWLGPCKRQRLGAQDSRLRARRQADKMSPFAGISFARNRSRPLFVVRSSVLMPIIQTRRRFLAGAATVGAAGIVGLPESLQAEPLENRRNCGAARSGT